MELLVAGWEFFDILSSVNTAGSTRAGVSLGQRQGGRCSPFLAKAFPRSSHGPPPPSRLRPLSKAFGELVAGTGVTRVWAGAPGPARAAAGPSATGARLSVDGMERVIPEAGPR